MEATDEELAEAGRALRTAKEMTNEELADALAEIFLPGHGWSPAEQVTITFEAVYRLQHLKER